MAITITDRGSDLTETSSDTTVASASFAPAAGSVLTACVYWIGVNTTPRTFTVTDTFNDVDVWASAERITAVEAGSGYSMVVEVFSAVAGPSQTGSGVITVTRSAGNIDQSYEGAFQEWAGVDTTSPIGLANSSDTTSGTSAAVNLGAAPAATSALIGILGNDDDAAAPVATPPTAWSELGDSFSATFEIGREWAYKIGSGAQTSTWTALDTGALHRLAVVVELAAASTSVELVVADATHAHTAGAVAVVQHHVLTVASATSAHTAANTALAQHHVLAVADATHAHTAANVTLTFNEAAVQLEVSDATHAHTAAAVALVQHHVLAAANATHAHTASAVALVQHHTLTVANATHAHTAGNVVLEIAGQLAVQDATHGHTAETVALIQHSVIVVADATHAHTAAATALVQHHVLTVATATSTHTAANVALVAGVVALTVDDATHAHSVDAPALTQHHVLTVANATHTHTAGVVLFAILVVERIDRWTEPAHPEYTEPAATVYHEPDPTTGRTL
jgi:hypothetical protein